jgi:hypothetical protein
MLFIAEDPFPYSSSELGNEHWPYSNKTCNNSGAWKKIARIVDQSRRS